MFDTTKSMIGPYDSLQIALSVPDCHLRQFMKVYAGLQPEATVWSE